MHGGNWGCAHWSPRWPTDSSARPWLHLRSSSPRFRFSDPPLPPSPGGRCSPGNPPKPQSSLKAAPNHPRAQRPHSFQLVGDKNGFQPNFEPLRRESHASGHSGKPQDTIMSLPGKIFHPAVVAESPDHFQQKRRHKANPVLAAACSSPTGQNDQTSAAEIGQHLLVSIVC